MIRRGGFTLIELLIVVSVVIIVAPAGMKLFMDLQHRQKEVEQVSDARFGSDRVAGAIRPAIAGASSMDIDGNVLVADDVSFRLEEGWLVRSEGDQVERLAEVATWEVEESSPRLYTIRLTQQVGEGLARRDVVRQFEVARRIDAPQEVAP